MADTILMERPGCVPGQDRPLSEVWESNSSSDTRTIDTRMRRLRNMLAKFGSCIKTVRGFGHRLAEPGL